jgi:hypothetical protein
VRLWDAGDDDNVYLVILEGFVDVAVGFGARVVLFGIVVWFRGALDDAIEFVSFREGEDEGDVEDFSAVNRWLVLVVEGCVDGLHLPKAVAYDGDVEGGLRRHGDNWGGAGFGFLVLARIGCVLRSCFLCSYMSWLRVLVISLRADRCGYTSS